MAEVVKFAPQIDPLLELQSAFCLIALGGDVRIIDRREIARALIGQLDEDVGMYKLHPGKLLMQRFLETLPVDTDPKKVIAEFLVSPNTQVFDTIAFDPRPTPPNVLNYWSGSPIEPVPGDWSVIKDFLRNDICDGDDGLFEYLTSYLAHMVQFPEEKPGIIPSLLGGQGTGKGTFGGVLRAIWSRTTLAVSNIDHVVGKYNAALERNFVIWMDEALFVGDKKAMDRLKSFVTEPILMIDQKNQPRRTIRSFHRFFAASNHAHFAQVDADDRRFLFLKVSNGRQGDLTYWKNVHAAINDPSVIAALVHDLFNRDLSNFNVRLRPKTEAHTDQKLRSLNGFDRYWFEVLGSGEFGTYVFPDPMGPWSQECFVSSDGLMSGWKDYEKGQRQFGARQELEMRAAMRGLCPSAELDRHQSKTNGQKRGYFLPSLTVARAEFEKAIGGEVDWDD